MANFGIKLTTHYLGFRKRILQTNGEYFLDGI